MERGLFFPLGKSGIAEPTLLPKGQVADAGGGGVLALQADFSYASPFRRIYLLSSNPAGFQICGLCILGFIPTFHYLFIMNLGPKFPRLTVGSI